MQYPVAQQRVDYFFQMLGTSNKCKALNGDDTNGVATIDLILDLPIHGINCPTGARKMIFRFPDASGDVECDVMIYDMDSKIIIQNKLNQETEIYGFLSTYFRKTDVREELIRINERMDAFLKMYKNE